MQEPRDQCASPVRRGADKRAETEHFEPVRPPPPAPYPRSSGTHCKQDGQAQDGRRRKAIRRIAGDDIWNERDGARGHECHERGNAVPDRRRLQLGQLLRFPHPLVRPDSEVVAHPHRESVGQQIGDTEDEHGNRLQRATRDAGDDGKGGDHAVVRAIDEVANVVLRNSNDAAWLDVQRISMTR